MLKRPVLDVALDSLEHSPEPLNIQKPLCRIGAGRAQQDVVGFVAPEHVVYQVGGDRHLASGFFLAWMPPLDQVYVNPTGRFVIGGPDGDSGLTGRKIIVDTYGGAAPHGGGAFSGKDPSKVDRSAAYAARYLAKNVVAAGLADRCTIQLSYAIGVAHPLSVYVNTDGTGKADEQKIAKVLQELMSLTPRGIRTHLKLNKPIYARTAAYGHFGRQPDKDGGFSWEKTDLADKLRSAF